MTKKLVKFATPLLAILLVAGFLIACGPITVDEFSIKTNSKQVAVGSTIDFEFELKTGGDWNSPSDSVEVSFKLEDTSKAVFMIKEGTEWVESDADSVVTMQDKNDDGAITKDFVRIKGKAAGDIAVLATAQLIRNGIKSDSKTDQLILSVV